MNMLLFFPYWGRRWHGRRCFRAIWSSLWAVPPCLRCLAVHQAWHRRPVACCRTLAWLVHGGRLAGEAAGRPNPSEQRPTVQGAIGQEVEVWTGGICTERWRHGVWVVGVICCRAGQETGRLISFFLFLSSFRSSNMYTYVFVCLY